MYLRVKDIFIHLSLTCVSSFQASHIASLNLFLDACIVKKQEQAKRVSLCKLVVYKEMVSAKSWLLTGDSYGMLWVLSLLQVHVKDKGGVVK